MDDWEFDALLTKKFSGLQNQRLPDSIAPRVIEKIDTLGESSRNARRRWVLGSAILLGALVCIPSLQALDIATLFGFTELLEQLPSASEFDWVTFSYVFGLPPAWLALFILLPFGLVLLADY